MSDIKSLARMAAENAYKKKHDPKGEGQSNTIIRSLFERLANADTDEEKAKIQKRLDIAREMLDR
jgi:hypothetical protein